MQVRVFVVSSTMIYVKGVSRPFFLKQIYTPIQEDLILTCSLVRVIYSPRLWIHESSTRPVSPLIYSGAYFRRLPLVVIEILNDINDHSLKQCTH